MIDVGELAARLCHLIDSEEIARAAIAYIVPREREECAKVADEYCKWHCEHDDGLSGFGHMAQGAEEVAAAIRNMKDTQP